MGHKALYREWRPRTFDEVVEQKFTVIALKQAVISGKIGHAYLFSGTRGTGKTTMAQIFARAVNCLDPQDGNPCNKCEICKGILNGSILDVIEMDAASNNNVDTIRRICDEVVFSPSVAKFKVYIIDEVHMLSTGAFNALLKTLEEPPAHAIFILATTEPHRIPATILSRCQRYEFRRISAGAIVKRLREICDEDKVDIHPDSLELIARISDGALRDAISLLDQAKGSFNSMITTENILSLVGMVQDDFLYDLSSAIVEKEPGKVLGYVDDLLMNGRDIVRFSLDLTGFFRNILICLSTREPSALLTISSKTLKDLKDLSKRITLQNTIDIIVQLSSVNSELKWSADPRITLETALISIMDKLPGENTSIDGGVEITPVTADVSEEAQISSDENNTVEDSVEITPVPSDIPEETKNSAEKSVTVKKNDEIIPEPAEASPIDEPDLWAKTLDRIIASGQMTVYLFLQPAKVNLQKDEIIICFSDEDKLNFEEVSKSENIKTISLAVKDVANRDIKVKVELDKPDNIKENEKEEGSKPGFDADKLKRSAEELGIAFHMED